MPKRIAIVEDEAELAALIDYSPRLQLRQPFQEQPEPLTRPMRRMRCRA
jgi:hypothetical protein